MESWETIATASQAALLNAIPTKWKLPSLPEESVTNVIGIPKSCGILTERQLSLTEENVGTLLSQLASGELTSVELTEAFCARAAIAHQCVNCLTAYFCDEALQRASELDSILKTTGKPVGPLHGLPIAIKDQHNMKGKATTMSAIAWHNNIAEADGAVVEAIQKAGAVPFARTHMPQTGMMLQTVSNLWGRTTNPANRTFSAGGSSGGDGALVAMHGSPITVSTDIGGSIRAPATFNGLYGIRPTSERIPKTGMASPASGQVSIKVSCGPLCHSMEGLKATTKVLLEHYKYIGYDPTCVPFPWQEAAPVPEKLCFGVLRDDGVVLPQPPVRRAIDETVQKLKAAGHEVVEIEPPFDMWEAAQVTWKLYMQTGAREMKALIASANEPLTENYKWYLDTYKIKELTVPELYKTNTAQAVYKRDFAKFWADTKDKTGTGRPIDAMVCPCAPSASFPHEFPVWWGYYSLFNLLDYPSTILPLKKFEIDPAKDVKDADYKPRTNSPFDKMNHDIYDAELWKGLPMCVQIVKPPFQDEDLIAVTDVVDAICNA